MLFLGNLACLLVAKWWLYREPRHKTLVANERKEGARENKKASSSRGSSEARDHPNVLCVVRVEMFHWQKILQRERLNNSFF